MSTSHVAEPVRAASPSPRHGHRLGVWSLLMLPLLIPAAIVTAIVQMSILHAAGLEGSEPMSVQGTAGWIAILVGSVILMSPMVVGIILGAKARAQGERLGTIGLTIDATILLAYTVLIVVGTMPW